MSRKMPPVSEQAASQSLRNNICRLESPEFQAKVSAHLRNCAVAEAIALVGMLDGHPRFKRAPAVGRGKAAFQQCKGTIDNPFCHVVPCNLLLDGEHISTFFTTPRAEAVVARIFGMGVMAPLDWAELNTFSVSPAQQNRADSIAERFGSGTGLVAAFEATASNAVGSCKWDGSGRGNHTRASLENLVRHHYGATWAPRAIEAYRNAIAYLSCRRAAAARAYDKQGMAVLGTRIGIGEVQRDFLLHGRVDFSEVINNVFVAAEMEGWREFW